jgi:hypothetical protein
VVPAFPASDLKERMNAAVETWIADIFNLYDVDPDPRIAARWEHLAWCLACDKFPNFRIVGLPNVGRPGTAARNMRLFDKFQSYENPRKGPKYKNFMRDHPADCRAFKTAETFKGAMLRARKQHDLDRSSTEKYLRHATMKALGII